MNFNFRFLHKTHSSKVFRKQLFEPRHTGKHGPLFDAQRCQDTVQDAVPLVLAGPAAELASQIGQTNAMPGYQAPPAIGLDQQLL